MRDSMPILVESSYEYLLMDRGDGKYYVWETLQGLVLEIYERDLAKILANFRLKRSIGGTTLSKMAFWVIWKRIMRLHGCVALHL